jgi:hypothetical protein
MFCRRHARQNHIFTHNPNDVNALAVISLSSMFCPVHAAQSIDSKSLAPKLSIMCILPVAEAKELTYEPACRQGGMAGGGRTIEE